ncbi:hypothetical protein ABH944_006569 [Caballeronia udeis]|jgi:hypothetical protein|uniref:Uncharacterized protein n=1 Tax=Caballeronia udeis TaxID=1232866 RepID=A0ABW8MSM0_9BURK
MSLTTTLQRRQFHPFIIRHRPDRRIEFDFVSTPGRGDTSTLSPDTNNTFLPSKAGSFTEAADVADPVIALT